VTDGGAVRVDRRGPSLARRALIVALVLVAAGAALAALLLAGGQRRTLPPILGAVPDFTLTERSGQPLRRADLAGGPVDRELRLHALQWHVPGAVGAHGRGAPSRCRRRPARALRVVQRRSDHDTPEVLREYAPRFGAGDDWLFLTGTRDALYDLIGTGFRLSVAERPASAVAAEGGELIAHSDRFVLVDGAGQIRGYYHGLDAGMPDEMVRDLAALAGER
jgi:protein SCO1/2